MQLRMKMGIAGEPRSQEQMHFGFEQELTEKTERNNSSLFLGFLLFKLSGSSPRIRQWNETETVDEHEI